MIDMNRYRSKHGPTTMELDLNAAERMKELNGRENSELLDALIGELTILAHALFPDSFPTRQPGRFINVGSRVMVNHGFYIGAPHESAGECLKAFGQAAYITGIRIYRKEDGSCDVEVDVKLDQGVPEWEGYQSDGRMLESIQPEYLSVL